VGAEQALLIQAYEAFNRRDPAALGAFFHAEVEWPDILEGGVIKGRQAVIDYFARQFELMIPDARLISVEEEPPARLVADVQYAVRNLEGRLWSDTRARLVYDFRDGLIVRMTVLVGL
jgi:ketosteroid isomerase-like protein